MCVSLIDLHTGVCSSKLSQHTGRERTEVCRVMISFQIWFQIWMSVTFIMFVINIFLRGYWMVQNIFWKIWNICPLSELWLQCVWTLGKHLHKPQEPNVSLDQMRWASPPNSVAFALSLSLRPHCQHHFASESFLGTVGNACLGKSQNQIQSWEYCVFKAEIKYFKQLFYNLSNSLW